MYVGNKHSTTATCTQIVEMECVNCGYHGHALIKGVGLGQGASPYFMDEEGAANRSLSRAEKAAEKNVLDTQKIAKCGRCGRRNQQNVRRFWLLQSLKIFGGIFFLLLLGSMIYSFDEDEVVYLIFGSVAILYIPLIFFLDIKWRWYTVDGRVHYIESEGGTSNEGRNLQL